MKFEKVKLKSQDASEDEDNEQNNNSVDEQKNESKKFM